MGPRFCRGFRRLRRLFIVAWRELIDKKVMARVIRGPLMVHVEPVGMPMPANGGSSSTLGSSSRVAAAAEAALLAQQQGLQLLQKQLSQHSSSVSASRLHFSARLD